MVYRLVRIGALVCAATLSLGCGKGSDSGGSDGAYASRAAAARGVDIEGTVVASPATHGGALLVFAFANLAPGADPASAAAASVDIVDAHGAFLLTNVESGSLTLVFLLDTNNDGAIDTGDPTAVVADTDQGLNNLQPGAQVTLADIRLDFDGHRAIPATIEVAHNGALSPAPTSTPAAR